MAISITKRFVCSRSTSTSSPRSTKETTRPAADNMSMQQQNNKKNNSNKNIAMAITKTLACSRPKSTDSPKAAAAEETAVGTAANTMSKNQNKTMATSIANNFSCSRPTSTSSPKATKDQISTVKSTGTISMNKRNIVTSRSGIFSTARKKIMKSSKLPHKDIIIIHNNTSITSNDEDNRTSCVEVINDIAATVKQGKETTSLLVPDVASSDETKSVTERSNHVVPPVPVDHAPVVAASANDDDTCNNKEAAIGVHETVTIDVTDAVDDIEPDGPHLMIDEANDNKKKKGEEVQDDIQSQLEVAQMELEAARKDEVVAAMREKASIRIQAAFRGHLSRRAFGALKSLIKLQAVVRGGCARRQQRMALHCMYAMVRLRVRVRARQMILNTKSISLKNE